MKFIRFYVLAMLGILLFLTFGACNKDNNDAEFGRMSVKLTDAPFPTDLVAEANVTIFKVDARDKSEDVEGSPFRVLMEEDIRVNLLELTNGVTETLAEAEVPVGSYDLVRVYVKDAEIIMKDGTVYPLAIPSGAQTGIKVFVDPEIQVEGGLTAELLLDFDVSRSFVPKGGSENPNGFNFKPVIKASNLSFAGRLEGLVTDAADETMVLEGAEVAVYAADTLNTTTFTDETGRYAVLGLLAGDYQVEVSLDGYMTSEAAPVEITAANRTVYDVALEVEP